MTQSAVVTLDPPRPPRRSFAKWRGECSCGAAFDEGDSIVWRGRVVGCPECDWTGEARPARADLVNVRGGGPGVAAALRRREEKRKKERARERAKGDRP